MDMDTMDERGNIIHHVGTSTEWRKQYDDEGREVRYERNDGQVAVTTYGADGAALVEWIPPLPEEIALQ